MGRMFRAASLGLALLGAGPVVAQESTPDKWTFTVSPYLWATGLQGDAGVRGRTVSVDQSFSDILENLDMAFMGLAEARRGRFGLFTDVVYADVSATQKLRLPDRSIKLSSKVTMWTVGGEYRLVDAPAGSVDAVGGVRAYWLDNELEYSGGILAGQDFEDKQSWADPFVGFKGSYNITPRAYLTGWAMVGGGVNADNLWDVMGAVGYRFTERTSGLVGYRASGVDYSDGGFKYDMTQQGVLAGVAFRF